MSASAVRVGIVGLGGMGQNHLRRLLSIEGAQVVGLCDRAPDRLAAGLSLVAGQEPEARPVVAVADHRDLLDRAEVDALFVCLPPSLRGEVELAAIAAGSAIMVEKPVALDLGLADEVFEAATNAGVISASGYQNRYRPEVERARQLLSTTTLRLAAAVRFARPPALPWLTSRRLSGGQVVEMATHQVDLLRLLVGEVQQVSAFGGPPTVSGDEVFLANASAWQFENGCVGNLLTNVVSHHGKPSSLRGAHVIGDDVSVSILGVEDEPQTFEYILPGGRETVQCADDTTTLQDSAFIAAVASGDPSGLRSDYRNGLKTLAVTLANEQAACEGGVVDVAELLAERAPVAARADQGSGGRAR